MLNTTLALSPEHASSLLREAESRLGNFSILYIDPLHPSAHSPSAAGQLHFIVFAREDLDAAEKQRIAAALLSAAMIAAPFADANATAVAFRPLPADAISVNGRFLSESAF